MSTEGARQAGLLNLSGKRTEKYVQTIYKNRICLHLFICGIFSGAADLGCSIFYALTDVTGKKKEI